MATKEKYDMAKSIDMLVSEILSGKFEIPKDREIDNASHVNIKVAEDKEWITNRRQSMPKSSSKY